MGLSHDGLKFLEGIFEGLNGYAVGRMTKSRRGKLYIDDAGWGPEAGSILEYTFTHFAPYVVLIRISKRLIFKNGGSSTICSLSGGGAGTFAVDRPIG